MVKVPRFLSANQFNMIEVFRITKNREVQRDNPLSFDKCYISFVSFYTDFTFCNVPSDQVIVINRGRIDQSVISIPRGTYDIETIITMLNASDALFEIVYSGENAFRVYNQFVIVPLTQLIHSLNKVIHLSRCVGT